MEQLNNVSGDVTRSDVDDTSSMLPSSDELFEQLYRVLHEYRCGRVGFLELLEQWKEILHLPPSTRV